MTTSPTDPSARHLRVVSDDNGTEWADTMEREAARQRLRAERAEAQLTRVRALAQDLLDELSGNSTSDLRGPWDVW